MNRRPTPGWLCVLSAVSVLSPAAPVHAAAWVDTLFGLSRVSWSQPGTYIGWRYPLPMWAWVGLVLLCVGVGWVSYNRLLGSGVGRGALAGVRALIVLLVVMLLAGPMLVLPQERVEPDRLLVLVDRSASMNVADAASPGDPTRREPRYTALSEALRQHPYLLGNPPETPNTDRPDPPEPANPVNPAMRDRRVVWLGFDENAYPLDPRKLIAPDAAQPEGQRTMIRTAIESALQQSSDGPVAGIVLFSDGRSAQEIDGELLQRLRQKSIGVYSVPLGAEHPLAVLGLDRIDAPARAMVNDLTPITVHLQREGGASTLGLRARLIDPATGEVLDESAPGKGEADETLHLSARCPTPGSVPWRVELVKDSASVALNPERSSDNVTIEFIDRPLRVLYVEGYPRWEYRYLKNLLIREKTIKSSIILIEADREFAQEGDVPLARLPVTPEEWRPFDVIIIGDVPENYFSSQQKTQITEQVSQRGAGLFWLGGNYHTPRDYATGPFAALLPMRRPEGVSPIDPSRLPMAVQPTAMARELGVLELKDPQSADPAELWPTGLPGLMWAQDLGPLKLATDVIAVGRGSQSESAPLLVRMRYGSGQSLYQGTDEYWRWRRGRGDIFFDQLYVQLIHMLGRSRFALGDRGVSFTVSSPRGAIEQPLVVELRIDDPLILQRQLRTIAVEVEQTDNNSNTPIDHLELTPGTPGSAPGTPGGANQGQAGGDEATPSVGLYRATWRPSTTGTLVLRVVEPALADLNLLAKVEATSPLDEMLVREADYDNLRELSQQTAGKVVLPVNLGELATLIPNRAIRTPADITEPLWRSPLALVLMVLLLTGEWVGRKVLRLA
ncbi:MAG: hypothetical protein GC164_01605 [Phycisphaera sp.]|nr:hypothetical protein [Phycisphaera sp.]